MPNKIAEAQFSHIAEREAAIADAAVNGDPVNPECSTTSRSNSRAFRRKHAAAGSVRRITRG